MNRRQFLAASGAVAATALPFRALAASQTDWIVRGSEGLDAVCFLGPLSGDDFYARYYPEELAQFSPRLKPGTIAEIKDLKARLAKENRLLGPYISLLLSNGQDARLDQVLAALAEPESRIRPSFAGSRYWSESGWRTFVDVLPALRSCLNALHEAGFPQFWRDRVSIPLSERKRDLDNRLAGYDLIPQLERYTGRRFNPRIDLILLQFCRPHGIKIQGQQFISAIGWSDDIVIGTASHEMLHPPVDMNGRAAEAAYAVLEQDPLLDRIVREHDPKYGYNSLAGLFDEDLASAIDQIIGEHFGVARPPSERWTKADGGMHVLSAAFYGLMQQDGFARTGGDLEAWLYRKAAGGWLAPPSLHGAAAKVLRRPADQLWPVQQ